MTEIETPRGADSLAGRFVIPPFTVLDARSDRWQQRKRYWNELGANDNGGYVPYEAGVYASGNRHLYGAAKALAQSESVFDPTLAELLYFWYSRPGDRVLDPYSGFPVKRIVAEALGRNYVGVDLAHERQPVVQATSTALPFASCSFDFCLACPPYAWAERYSEHELDLSNTRTLAEFVELYRPAMHELYRVLRYRRYAVFVVGPVRDRKGVFCDLPRLTANLAEEAGLVMYDEAVLLTAIGSAPIRAPLHFSKARKLERVHQRLLVFHKGLQPTLPAELGRPYRFPWEAAQPSLFSAGAGSEDGGGQ